MSPDTTSPFGRHRPAPVFHALIALAQRAPRNAAGQQVAQLARRIVLRWCPLPIDASVDRIRMRCYLRDNNSEKKFVFMPWRFDPLERDLLLRALPPDGVFLDIGANVGIYSLCAAVLLGPSGRIIAFEPNPAAFARLGFNLAATREGRGAWPRVDTVPVGVSDAPGEAALHLDPANLGGSSLFRRKPASRPGGEVVRVPCRPLLPVLEELSVTRIDALKIDIEGAEDLALVPFLRDAPDALLPRLLFTENSERLWKLDLAGALEARGYRIEARARGNTVYRLSREEPGAGPPLPGRKE